LSLTGLRYPPLDPKTKTPVVGHKNEVYRHDRAMGDYKDRILKERVTFSGGFKIPEEYRKNQKAMLGVVKKEVHHDQENVNSG